MKNIFALRKRYCKEHRRDREEKQIAHNININVNIKRKTKKKKSRLKYNGCVLKK